VAKILSREVKSIDGQMGLMGDEWQRSYCGDEVNKWMDHIKSCGDRRVKNSGMMERVS